VNWIELLGAVGLGAILTKVMDAVWLSRVTQRAAKLNWLRDKRLDAYSAVAQDFLSLGLSKDPPSNPFETYGRIARAMLLVEDRSLG
jgi:hypothetical protein